jgi:hypothetical protein
MVRAQIGHGHCQAQTEYPQRVRIAYLGDIPILPALAAHYDEKFTAEAEENGDAAAIDQEIEARQARLEALAPERPRRGRRTTATRKGAASPAPPPDEDDDDPNDEAGLAAAPSS